MKKLLKSISSLLILILILAPSTDIANANSDKGLIRNLFYGLQQAMQNGTASGIAYIEKNNYPNVITKGTNWERWKAARIQAGFSEIISPDLTTMDTDSTWMWGAGFCHPAMTKPPKGKTYIFNTTASHGVIGGQMQTETLQAHATIWNGRAYFYLTICGSAN